MRNGSSGCERCKVVVISRRDANERRAAFESLVPDDVSWSYLDALTSLHPELVYDETEATAARGRTLSGGELGCYSSHYSAWERLVEDHGAQAYIVLEDDVLVDWDFIRKLRASVHQAPDYLRLYQKQLVRFKIRQRGFVERTKTIVHTYGYSYGTQAYLISKKAARRFLDHGRRIMQPVDDMMDQEWMHGVPSLCLFPSPVLERSIASTIGMDRFDKAARPEPSLRDRLVRSRRRARYYRGLVRFWLT